jgi:squalene-hopene/tetraprenyl-beta-curcumene cyclase
MARPLATPYGREARERLLRSYEEVKAALLGARNSHGHWTGELSTSALSTATAVMALEMVRRGMHAAESAAGGGSGTERSIPSPLTGEGQSGGVSHQRLAPPPQPSPTRGEGEQLCDSRFQECDELLGRGGSRLSSLIDEGVAWIAAHQNPDGGWGDTTRSFSNISTTMLCRAAIHATGRAPQFAAVVAAAGAHIDRAGGVPALRARYGKDKTFSIPILTHCALAGLVDWRDVAPLPFELACIPADFYKWVRLPVVSYALPALIAIGQVRHHFLKPRNPLARFVRWLARGRSLAILDRIQPTSGGFLEAAPLTSFVTMSLAGMGLIDHPVTRRGVEFLTRTIRPDGSWPIDTNLATWVTTLSINALGPDLPADAVPLLVDWLLGQQYREVHPYTNSDPGGWAWTDLPGGVPDADDTPGAILALIELERRGCKSLTVGRPLTSGAPVQSPPPRGSNSLEKQNVPFFQRLGRGARWLLDLQNGDGGWPTFCRGWGALPFDRSAPDLTAHAVRALDACRKRILDQRDEGKRTYFGFTLQGAIDRGFDYLARTQRAEGSWLPLWFGNQHAPNDENPTYGTARVLAAYRDVDRIGDAACQRGVAWLKNAQNADGGWGGAPGIVSSIEETALALEVLLSLERSEAVPSRAATNGLNWLLNQIDNGKLMEPSPIGFYFAKLWYFEKLYPLIFTAAALRRAVEWYGGASGAETTTGTL